jgi:hypothetical protein
MIGKKKKVRARTQVLFKMVVGDEIVVGNDECS